MAYKSLSSPKKCSVRSDLCVALTPSLERKTRCNHRHETFQREMSDRSGISQPSFSCIMPQVIKAILQVLFTRYISSPFTILFKITGA